MSLLSYIGIVGGICSLVSYWPYFSAVIKNKPNVPAPERVPWLIWTLTSLLILMTYWELGARTTIWLPLSYVIGSASLTILAFIKSKEDMGQIERIDLIVAIIASIYWVFFNQPIVVLILAVTVGFRSYVPNIMRLIREREKAEYLDLEGWTLLFMGATFNLIAVSPWTPLIAALPIALFIMNGIMFGLTFRNSLSQEKQPPLSQ